MTDIRFTADYNGGQLRPGEVMVPFPWDPLDAESCANRACIRTVMVAGRRFGVIYRAVPEAWAREACAALTLVENEALGHYVHRDTVSLEVLQECGVPALGEYSSPEEHVLEAERREETRRTYTALMLALIRRSAKLAYGLLLTQNGVRGRAFGEAMHLGHSAAADLQQQARAILQAGLANLDPAAVTGSRSRHDAEYREKACRLLNEIAADCA